jgi:addiction module HigA family antidote
METNEYLVMERPRRILTYPGLILKEDVLPNLGLSITTAAKELGVSRQTLHRILKGTHPITPSMALRLGRFCDSDPALWLRLQQAFDLKKAEVELEDELKKIPLHVSRASCYPKDDFDGFSIEISKEEDGDWIALFEELPHVSAFGDSPENALLELYETWEGIKESYEKHNEPIPIAPSKKDYSGQFNVHIDKRIHHALAIEAAQAGISLNALVAQKLSQSVKSPEE